MSVLAQYRIPCVHVLEATSEAVRAVVRRREASLTMMAVVGRWFTRRKPQRRPGALCRPFIRSRRGSGLFPLLPSARETTLEPVFLHPAGPVEWTASGLGGVNGTLAPISPVSSRGVASQQGPRPVPTTNAGSMEATESSAGILSCRGGSRQPPCPWPATMRGKTLSQRRSMSVGAAAQHKLYWLWFLRMARLPRVVFHLCLGRSLGLHNATLYPETSLARRRRGAFVANPGIAATSHAPSCWFLPDRPLGLSTDGSGSQNRTAICNQRPLLGKLQPPAAIAAKHIRTCLSPVPQLPCALQRGVNTALTDNERLDRCSLVSSTSAKFSRRILRPENGAEPQPRLSGWLHMARPRLSQSPSRAPKSYKNPSRLPLFPLQGVTVAELQR